MDMPYLHLPPIQSAPGQKVKAEPVGNHQERSQGRAAMLGLEVASFPGEMELHLGWSHKRATSFLPKFVLSASSATGRAPAHAVSGVPMVPVRPATAYRAQNVRFTDEVRRGPALSGRVSLGYKSKSSLPHWEDDSAAHASGFQSG
jgi:hypothetical protein